MNKLSIIFPCYNQPNLLEEAFSVLQNSTEKRFVKVIKDDCSMSDYSNFLNNEKWQPLKYLRNTTNLGAIDNMISCLFVEGKGEYVMCHHEDDMLHPDYLKIAIEYLDKHPEISFIGSEFSLFSKKETIKFNSYPSPIIEKYNSMGIAKFFANDNNLAFGSIIYRKNNININQVDTKQYAMMFDRPFLIEILKQNKSYGAIIKAPLYFYRHHDYPDNRWKGLKTENIFNLYNKYKQINNDCHIFARYFFDFAGIDNKRIKDYKYFVLSLFRLKLKISKPKLKSIKYIMGGGDNHNF